VNPRRPFHKIASISYDSDSSTQDPTLNVDEDGAHEENAWTSSEDEDPITAKELEFLDDNVEDDPDAMRTAFPDGFKEFLKKCREDETAAKRH
jgi:hypothetical protein